MTPQQSRFPLFKKNRMLVDLSPMIDLVFLLLIFFMISSRLVTIRLDTRVQVPFASAAMAPESTANRFLLNVYQDGTIGDVNGRPVPLSAVKDMSATAKLKDPQAKLHLRADKRAEHADVKKVIDAAADGGLREVVFSTDS